MTQFKCAFLLVAVLLALCQGQGVKKQQSVGQQRPLQAQAATPAQRDAKCMQPMEPGPCRMSLERYYYNAQTNTCETFRFGGCQGNDNKFGFRQTCEAACVRSSGGRSAPGSSAAVAPVRPSASTAAGTSTRSPPLRAPIAATTSRTTTARLRAY